MQQILVEGPSWSRHCTRLGAHGNELGPHGSSLPRVLSLVRDTDVGAASPTTLDSVAQWREVWGAMKLIDRLLLTGPGQVSLGVIHLVLK